MQTEIEKRIEEYISKLGMTHDRNTNPNVIHPPSMRLMAKFILELPELREAFRLVKAFYELGDDTYCTCGVELGSERSWENSECLYHEAKDCLDKLKALGIIAGGSVKKTEGV